MIGASFALRTSARGCIGTLRPYSRRVSEPRLSAGAQPSADIRCPQAADRHQQYHMIESTLPILTAKPTH